MLNDWYSHVVCCQRFWLTLVVCKSVGILRYWCERQIDGTGP